MLFRGFGLASLAFFLVNTAYAQSFQDKQNSSWTSMWSNVSGSLDRAGKSVSDGWSSAKASASSLRDGVMGYVVNPVLQDHAGEKGAAAGRRFDQAGFDEAKKLNDKYLEWQKQDKAAAGKALDKAGKDIKAAGSNLYEAGSKLASGAVDLGKVTLTEAQMQLVNGAIRFSTLSSDFSDLYKYSSDTEALVRQVEKRMDDAVVGAYMQQKVARLLNSPNFCNSAKSCVSTGKPTPVSLKDIKDIFPNDSGPGAQSGGKGSKGL